MDRRLTPDRLLVYPVVILLTFVLLWSVRMAMGAPVLPDYLARWTAGRMIVTGDRADLYDPAAQAAVQGELSHGGLSWFVSPPPVALASLPFGALPYPLAAACWTLLSLVALSAAARLTASLHPSLGPLGTWRGVVIAAASLPVLELVGGGQDTALLAFALASGGYLVSRHQDLGAGLALSVFIGKPHLALLVPVALFVFRRWKTLVWTMIFGGLWVTISVAVLGFVSWVQWVDVVTSPIYRETISEGQAWKMVTVRALLTDLLPHTTPSVVVTALWLSAATAIVGVFVVRVRRLPAELLSLVLVGFVPLSTLLVSPHGPVYELVLAIPGMCLAVVAIATPRARVLVAMCFVLTALNPALHALAGGEWPLRLVGAGWVVLPLVVVWYDLGVWFSDQQARVGDFRAGGS